MPGESKAVFLSYASEDSEAAQRIADALTAAGIEVWFDKSELRGGDTWDQAIRRQIHECRLFVPIISAQTQAREEGYFRREWRLASDRTLDMAHGRAFLVPVAVDDTDERAAKVPDSFREVQWTRLTTGTTSPEFVRRIGQLLSGTAPASPPLARGSTTSPSRKGGLAKRLWPALAIALAGLAAYLSLEKPWAAKPALVASFSPPPHSIAVLPFVNMSGDKEQEYFSEGLTEEILNSLARLKELRVAARTSSFSFQGQHPDIGTVARNLNVGAVLEGSVRRSGQTVRISTQLVNGVTGYQLWSQTFDRNLSDILQLQTEIANAVASALKVTLIGDITTKIELGGTRVPAAFDAHLRASKAYMEGQTEQEILAAIAGFTQAIRFDPNYALAYADRSLALAAYAVDWAKAPALRAEYGAKALADARKAIALAPDLSEGHLALAGQLLAELDFIEANQEYDRALALAPGNARVLRNYGMFAAQMGRFAASLRAAYRSVELDPLNPSAHGALGWDLAAARRFKEAIAALKDAKALAPRDPWINSWLGYSYYRIGTFQEARTMCETGEIGFLNGFCLALVYDKLDRHADAESMLTSMQASWGDAGAVFYSMVYAAWGDRTRALDWLDTAVRHRDPYLTFVRTRFDALRDDGRFRAIETALKFPE